MTIEASAVDFLHVAERSEWVHPLSGLVIRDEDMPDEATLARVADPATVRRAPKYGAFIGAGVLVGVVLGVFLATVLDTGVLTDRGGVLPFLAGANGARAMAALALGALGALVGALLALLADARSRARGR